jgi:hypothetical protein
VVVSLVRDADQLDRWAYETFWIAWSFIFALVRAKEKKPISNLPIKWGHWCIIYPSDSKCNQASARCFKTCADHPGSSRLQK